MSLRVRLGLCLLVAVGLIGCRGGGPTPTKSNTETATTAKSDPAQPVAPAEQARAEALPAPKIETDMFALTLASAGGDKVGADGTLSIHLEGRGEWHVNQEYPIEFQIQAPEGLGVVKPKLVRQDAKAFGEEEAKFESGIAPKAAGAHEVKCEASFAMCTDENCVLEKRTLALNVQVE